MKVTDKIAAKINRIDTGDVFGYDTLGLTSDEIIAGSKALSRLVDKGVIKRARKGYYYKPKVLSNSQKVSFKLTKKFLATTSGFSSPQPLNKSILKIIGSFHMN